MLIKEKLQIIVLGEFVVLARMTVWHFKEGKSEKGFSELDVMLNTLAHQTEGFRGAISLLDADDPNVVTILTLWIDEEALKRSEKEVFNQALKRVQDSIDSPPKIKNYRVFSTELFQRSQWPFRWA
jgi:heme-degrading monooxygenase HmoA